MIPMVVLMQRTDAALLFLVAFCTVISLCEDRQYAHNFFMRLALAGLGFCCAAQAFWLLGVWRPSSAGFPWPRLSFDAMLALCAVLRSRLVLRSRRRNRPYT